MTPREALIYIEEQGEAAHVKNRVLAHFAAIIANFAGQVPSEKALKGTDIYLEKPAGKPSPAEAAENVASLEEKRRDLREAARQIGPSVIPVDPSRFRR